MGNFVRGHQVYLHHLPCALFVCKFKWRRVGNPGIIDNGIQPVPTNDIFYLQQCVVNVIVICSPKMNSFKVGLEERPLPS